MGLLRIDYNKPGKGVEKDEGQKHRFFIFFDVLFRKFMKFVQLNMLYIVFSLPYMFILYWFSPLNANTLSYVTGAGIGDFIQSLPHDDFSNFDFVLRMLFTFGISILWGVGPGSAGSAYVMRNFAREEHAWVFSDFWDNVKHNFKQSIIVLFVDILVLYLSLVAFNFYSSQYAATPNQMYLIIEGILGFLLIIYTFIHYYIYQLMVTYEVSIKDLYKNAMLFAIAKFPQNVIFTILVFGTVIGMYLLINVFAFIVFVMIFTILCRFIVEFYTSEVIRRMTDQPQKGQQ